MNTKDTFITRRYKNNPKSIVNFAILTCAIVEKRAINKLEQNAIFAVSAYLRASAKI